MNRSCRQNHDNCPLHSDYRRGLGLSSKSRTVGYVAVGWIAALLVILSATLAAADRRLDEPIRLSPAAEPFFSVLELEITPDDQLDLCTDVPGVNDPLDLQNLALEEQHVLRLVMLANDADGDPLTILPPILSAAVDNFTYTINGDTLEVTIDLGEGRVTIESCERLGDLTIAVREDIPNGETVYETLGFYGMWEGADLAVQLHDVQPSYPLGAIAAIWGRIEAVTGDQYLTAADTFLLHIVITTPNGLQISNDEMVTGLFIPYRIEAPRFSFIVPGQYEARFYFEGHDLNPTNNDQRIPFDVVSGPFQVYPNTITPNGDGANDEVVFRFDNQVTVYPHITIFTLDGKQIFATDQMQGSRMVWDGRDEQGRLVPPGSYLYVVYDGGRTMDQGICAVVR